MTERPGVKEATASSTSSIACWIGSAIVIDANGLEGLPATYAFQRRLNRIEASAEEVRSGRYRQYLFRWRAPDASRPLYRFQLSASPDGAKLLVDEAGLKETAFVVTDLPPGTYHWRVMTLDSDGSRVYEKWSPFQELRIERDP